MVFNLTDFTNAIRDSLYANFPYEDDSINAIKHKKRRGHIRDIAFKNNPITYGGHYQIFDIGNEYAESKYPYYHILQDAQVIHIRGKGTKKSKGSQAKITNLGKRDYGHVNWNGKTYTQEYSKNVRGMRSKADKARRTIEVDGKKYVINKNATYYYNKHYQYIDRILDSTLPFIAQEFGLITKRKVDAGLEDEFKMQWGILDILGSFGG